MPQKRKNQPPFDRANYTHNWQCVADRQQRPAYWTALQKGGTDPAEKMAEKDAREREQSVTTCGPCSKAMSEAVLEERGGIIVYHVM